MATNLITAGFDPTGATDTTQTRFIIVGETNSTGQQGMSGNINGSIVSNTSGQIYFFTSGTSIIANTFNTLGWIDTRGRYN